MDYCGVYGFSKIELVITCKGKEAVAMRQAVLVVLLIGAAFLGGAFVAGPGFEWALARMLRSLNISNSGEIAAVILETNSNGEVPSDRPETARRGGVPPDSATQTSKIALQNKFTKGEEFTAGLLIQPAQLSSIDGSRVDQGCPLSLPSVMASQLITKSSTANSVRMDSEVMPVGGDSLTKPFHSTLSKEESRLPALTGPVTIVSPPIKSSFHLHQNSLLSHHLALLKSTRSTREEWTRLESMMQSLGISHFIIEGEPSGRIIFACLIPLAGRQAVTQRFEANGENVIQAAHSALHRVILWRVTELPQNCQVPSWENNEISE
jgi:hypothetical protein